MPTSQARLLKVLGPRGTSPRRPLLALCWSVPLALYGFFACSSGEPATDGGPAGPALNAADAGQGREDVPDAGDEPPPPPPPLTKGPLAGLPSKPGPHIAKIEALGDGEWLKLDTPAEDPVHGMARGRGWGSRALIPASEFRGAFFFGEGVHAFVKPDGYAMDDLWFYDVNQNQWIAVYPGLHIASFNERVSSGKVTIDENGLILDENKNALPIHTLIHAWDFMTYDTKRHEFAWIAGSGLGRYYLPGEEKMEPGLTTLEEKRAQISDPSPLSPWYYNTGSATFRRDVIENRAGDVGPYSAFLYLPEQDRYINAGHGGVQFFDPTSGRWTRAEDKGPRPTGYDHGIAYDHRRGQIYMGSGTNQEETRGAYIYDLATSTWHRSSTKGAPKSFRTADASVMYDVANDVITILHYLNRLVYTYKADDDTWSSVPLPEEVVKSPSYAAFHGFYDVPLNTYFVYAAGDSNNEGVVMWAYRYRNKK